MVGFIYCKATGQVSVSIIGPDTAVADQSPEDGYEMAYGIAASAGQYYNAVTGAVQDGPLS